MAEEQQRVRRPGRSSVPPSRPGRREAEQAGWEASPEGCPVSPISALDLQIKSRSSAAGADQTLGIAVGQACWSRLPSSQLGELCSCRKRHPPGLGTKMARLRSGGHRGPVLGCPQLPSPHRAAGEQEVHSDAGRRGDELVNKASWA